MPVPVIDTEGHELVFHVTTAQCNQCKESNHLSLAANASEKFANVTLMVDDDVKLCMPKLEQSFSPTTTLSN